MRERERRRAQDALDKALAVKGEPFQATYRSYADRLGPAIITNGLGQALATELAAAGDGKGNGDKAAHRKLAEHVAAWLRTAGIYLDDDVMAALVAGDQARYLRAQAEVLAWLAWHKKFCHASLTEARPTEGEP